MAIKSFGNTGDKKNNNTGDGLSNMFGDGLSGLLGGDGLSGLLGGDGLSGILGGDGISGMLGGDEPPDIPGGNGLPDPGFAEGLFEQFGGDWPENDFTKQIPKPDFGLTVGDMTDSEFSVLFQGATIEQIKDYVEKVKATGFTVNASTEDENIMGIVIYSYEAKNSAGYKVEVFSAMGMAGLTVTKP